MIGACGPYNLGGSATDRHPLRSLPTNPPQVPRKEDQGKDTRSQRSCAPEDPINEGKAQALSTMGRALYSDRSNPTGHLPTGGQQWQCSHQHLEH